VPPPLLEELADKWLEIYSTIRGRRIVMEWSDDPEILDNYSIKGA
jgi:hypothetical protein